MTWRIGGVPYLNAKPLLWGLDSDPAVRLVLKPPSKLAPDLAAGRLDAALLPAMEALRRDWRPAAGVGIACRGAVESVLLHLKRPVRELRTVALDPNSRTSNALVRILLERRFGISPRYVTHDPTAGDFRHDPKIDAALTIGDASFRKLGLPTLDLGAAWAHMTGLPFVFAVWAMPERQAALEARLARAAHEGRARIAGIARRDHASAGLSVARAKAYLERSIVFDLGPEERLGLKLFERHARDLGLLSGSRTPRPVS